MGTEIVVADRVRPLPDDRSIMSRFVDRVRSLWHRGAPLAGMAGGMLNGGVNPVGSFWWWDEDAHSGPPVTEANVLGIPSFGRGVDLIASTIAGIDLLAQRWNDEHGIWETVQPSPSIVSDPDLTTDRWQWAYSVVNDLILWGNAFAWPVDLDDRGIPQHLVGIDATTVSVADVDGMIVWKVGDELVPFGGLWHCSAGNRTGALLGRGVLHQYREALGGVLATSHSGREYFRRGGLPAAVFKMNDPDTTQAQADQLKARWRATVGRGSREPLVINSRTEFTPVVANADEQQLVDAREFDAEQVATLLGIPPHMMPGIEGTSMTYQNVESADIAFQRDTVNRWAQPIEASIGKWLLPPGWRARHDWEDRVRHDAQGRADWLETEINAGTMTLDEARQILNRPPIVAGQPAQTREVEA